MYVGFFFSTIASISVAIDVYKAIIYIVYIYIDPSSNINYLTPSLLLVPFYSQYNPCRGLDNIQRVDCYKLKELEFNQVITFNLTTRQDTIVSGGIPTTFVDIIRSGGSDSEKNFFILFDQPFYLGYQIAAAIIEAQKVKELYTKAFDYISTVIAFKGLLK